MSEGFASVNRRPLVILVPLLINIYLGFGAIVSFGPLYNDLSGWLTRMVTAQTAPAGQADTSGQVTDLLAAAGRLDMRAGLAIVNAIPLLPALRQAPALDAVDGARAIPAAAGVMWVNSPLLVVGIILLINLLTLPLSALFLIQIGSAISRSAPLRGWGSAIGRVMLSFLGFWLILLSATLVIGLPMLLLAGILLTLSAALSALVRLVFITAVFAAQLVLAFAVESIVLDGHGPIRAIVASYRLVRSQPLPTLLFLALVAFIIPRGFEFVWQTLGASTAGLIGAVVGSSYIGSGIAAARMIFYREQSRIVNLAPQRNIS